ncbi:SCO family protein [Hydrogenophaga sp.]|uniref:SCO family protein n=1 Tax=Hydrogenophaga sp. TaxID=1904254 RepID=UPI0035AEF79A
MFTSRLIRFFLPLLLACTAVGLLPACSQGESAGTGAIDVTGADYARDFRLQDTGGAWRTLADYRGKVVMVFFGFTQCPDICPGAMTQAAEVLQRLGDDGRRVQVLFISLDPERDTPEILHAFVSTFHPSFVALRGDPALTQQTAESYRVFYRKVPAGGSYTIDHSALVYVYDKDGQLRRALRPGMTAEQQIEQIRPFLSPPV